VTPAAQAEAATRSPEPGVPVEARSAPRLPASAVPGITGVRLSPHGADATMLNISTTGVLVECTSRLRIGTAVTTLFDGTFSPSSVEGRVSRSTVSNMSKDGVLRYQIGIAFLSPIALELAVAAPNRQPEATSQTPSETSPASSEMPLPPVLSNRW
jgi:hypothetical protein